jgi:ribonucleoside-diphosphate reductase alpha chain
VLKDNAQFILEKRYLMEGERTWEDLCHRVAQAISTIEVDPSYWKARFFDMLCSMRFIPGGRILRNAGRTHGSMFNCYHLPIGDSIKEIARCNGHALELWSEGGGVGITFSTLRPKGAPIKGKGGTSSGLVSFMRALDGLAATIESGGSRRAASLGGCHVSHPEIFDFINAKLAEGTISYFNISVMVWKDFLSAVMADDKWPLKFREQVYSVVQARDLWNLILKNMIHNGEPGLLVLDNLTKNNSYYFAPITGTNPCGEACLAPYDVCDLGSIVLPTFVDTGGRTKWAEMERTIHEAVRFLDNIIDINKYVLQENQQMGQAGRRIGLGVMGLADYLFHKGIRYGSKDSLDAVEDLMKFIRDTTYIASIKLATEKGSFAAFSTAAYHSASFIRKLPAAIRKDIRTYGIRNVTSMALAPTGTISLLADCNPGIEPLPFKAYLRKTRSGNLIYVNPILEESIKENSVPPTWLVDSTDLKPADHLEVQSMCQKYTDGAVSKTIIVPKDFTEDKLSDILLEYLFDLKGVTVYRDGSRKEQILNSLSIEEVKKHLKSNKHTTSQSEADVACASGVCEL